MGYGPAILAVLLTVTCASAHQAYRQAQALNLTRGLGLKRIQLSDEQIAALKARSEDHLVLIQALKQVRDIKRALNISIDIPGFNTSSFVQAIKDRLAPLLANLTLAGDFNSTRLAAALNQAVTLLTPNITTKPPSRSLLQSGTSDGSYPTSWDSRTSGPIPLVSPVRDQGQCGTCAAFSTTSAMEGSIAQAQQQNALNLPQLSPQWLYFCAGLYPGIQCSGSNSGMNLDYVDEAIPNIGIQYEACYPYNPNAGNSTCGAANPATCGPLGPGGGWQELEFINVNMAYSPSSPILAQDLLNAKAHIRTYGGVVSGFFIDNAFQSYSGGIYQQSPPWQTSQGHAVEIIGYNDEGNPPYWIAKNSWGTGWGEQGFFQIAYSGTALMAMDANGFIYSPSGQLSTGGTTTQSMVCYGIFYSQVGQTGDSFNVKSNPVTLNSPAANYTYSDLSFVSSATTGSSWINNIKSYTLQCNCTNTGSCITLAQGMTFKYWTQVNLTGTVTSVTFTTDNCSGGQLCAINNNLIGNVGSMAVQWVPPTAGVIGAGQAPPSPPIAASLVSSNWMVTLVAGIAAMAMAVLLPHATTV